jgi:hypothetical protein
MISLSGLLLPLTEPLSKTSAVIMFVRIRAIVTAGESTVTTAESQVGDGSSRDEDRDQARLWLSQRRAFSTVGWDLTLREKPQR